MADINSLLETAKMLANATVSVGIKTREQQDHIEIFDQIVSHPRLVATCRKLFDDGHYARAVEEAAKALCAHVKQRTALNVDGTNLMQVAFSEKNPRLRLNDRKSRSQKDEQTGHMHLFMGFIMGIRNPRAHDPDYKDAPDRALKLLVVADYLFGVVDEASTVTN